MVFCAEDRALMCRGCDVMVHSANASVARHARHLLTGWVVALHGHGADEAGSSADTMTATVVDVVPANMPSTSAREPIKRTTNKGHPYRANGTAEYEDYDALRQLLGYPTPNAPTRKTSSKPPKAPTTRASSGSAGPSLHELTAGAGNDTAGGASTSQAPITLTAAELLGMPIADELSAKDIDAVFMPDTYTALDDFDVDFSSLFAVPDFGPPSDDMDAGERKNSNNNNKVCVGAKAVSYLVNSWSQMPQPLSVSSPNLLLLVGTWNCHRSPRQTMAWFPTCLAQMPSGCVCDERVRKDFVDIIPPTHAALKLRLPRLLGWYFSA